MLRRRTPASAAGRDAAPPRGALGRQLRIRQVPALVFARITASPPDNASRRYCAATCRLRTKCTCSKPGAKVPLPHEHRRCADPSRRCDPCTPHRSRSRATSAPTVTPWVDARAAPRVPRRRPRLRCVLLRAVRRCAALPRAARPRPAHAARPLPERTRGHGHVRLRLARPARRARTACEVVGRADRDRPPPVEPAVRTINVIDAKRPQAGVLVRRLVARMGLPFTRDAAVCLYAALVCDTGRFQYESTTPEVFDLAGELATFDLPIARLCRTLFEEHRFAYLQLLADVLAATTLVPEKRFVWTKVTQAALARHGVSFEEVEGLIDVVRRTREAEVACVLKEAPDGGWRVSLRSVGEVDVCRIAESTRWRRHRFAAGFTSDESPSSRRQAPRVAVGRRARQSENGTGASATLTRVRRRRQASGLDVARRRRQAAQVLRATTRRTRGHARSRRDRASCSSVSGRATRLLRFLQETTKSYRARTCSASPPTRSTRPARCSSKPR